MPTITFSLRDLQELVGKKIPIKDVEKFVEYGKGEMKGYQQETDEVTVDFDDTNLPYLWSVEGAARLIRGLLGAQKGFSKVSLKKGGFSINVEDSVRGARPFIAGLVAKGKKIDEALLKQLIQLQEKLCDSYGKKRSKVAMGIYPCDKITFPVTYRGIKPKTLKFVPLDLTREMDLGEILEQHPKGKEYASLLQGKPLYPVLIDSKGAVLSFPPIINSANTGKIEAGDEHIFVEVTGTDQASMQLCLNIVAYALSDRGFGIYGVEVNYGSRASLTPLLKEEKIKVVQEDVKRLFGLEISKSDMHRLLEKAGYSVTGSGIIIIPPYRGDILHPYDVVEDIGIMYGYENIEEKSLKSYTTGAPSPQALFSNVLRELAVGLGFQEVLSPVLCNTSVLSSSMGIKDLGTVAIENFMSETYNCLRSWLIPVLMELLSKNKHEGYPQKIFEAGKVAVQKSGKACDFEHMALASAHDKADYTEARQIADYLMRMVGARYTIEETEHGSFIPGRVGRLVAQGKAIGYLGEINPGVLAGWGMGVPAIALELNLTELLDALSSLKPKSI